MFSIFRLIETDAKSLNSLQSGHSRRSSDTSQISVTSGSSFQDHNLDQIAVNGTPTSMSAASSTSGGSSGSGSNGGGNKEEDLWTLWGKIINEWDANTKKRMPQLKVRPIRAFAPISIQTQL